MSRYADVEKMPSGPSWDVLNDKEKTAVLSFLIQLPTADVEEVKYGKWEHGREVHREYIGDALLAIYYDKWWCSQCHYTIDDQIYQKITYKRCPECGAHMDR